MSSFERINYAIRPNKNVERKLIVEALGYLRPQFPIQDYTYIGLGSLWFVDFIMAHRYLHIQELFSIEGNNYKRADFNRPFTCINVLDGDTTPWLETIELNKKRHIIWLDYDGGLDNSSAINDIGIITRTALSGSLLLVTVNVHPDQIPRRKGKKLAPEDLTRLAGGLAADFVPLKLPEGPIFRNFQKIVAQILFNCMKRGVLSSGRKEYRFYPLFNFYYKDGAPMVTTGGMIVDTIDLILLKACELAATFKFVTEERQFPIDVPPLTTKEKLTLDKLLPTDHELSVEEISKEGFILNKNHIESYQKLYKYYPSFGEILI